MEILMHSCISEVRDRHRGPSKTLLMFAGNLYAPWLNGTELTRSLTPLRDFLSFVHKGQGGGVEAETQAGGLGAVIKNMA